MRRRGRLRCPFHDEPGTAAEEETFALSDGVKPVAAVGAEDFASLELDDFALALAEVAAYEVVVVDFSEEADALGVFAVGAGEVGGVGYVAHLALHEVADREHEL